MVTPGEAADLLGVSVATIRNWRRAGHLEAIFTGPLTFGREAVLALRERIHTNRFSRLRTRANKSASGRRSKVGNLDARFASDLDHIGRLAVEAGHEPVQVLFTAALHYLDAMGEVALAGRSDSLPSIEKLVWKRTPVREVMLAWNRRLTPPKRPVAREIFAPFLEWNDCGDRLGLLYQGLSSVGEKARAGAYFTPGQVVDDALAGIGASSGIFLDPCCGTGRYLVRAVTAYGLDPTRLYGFDSDPVAVDIARLNLLLACPDMDSLPRVRCLDSLCDLASGEPGCDTNHLLGQVDAIATNPPWGGCKNQTLHKNLVALIKSGESFSLFLEKSLRLLREGGRLSFLLPESMLKIKAHADIRRLLLAETSIHRITLLGRVFAGVFTPIIRLDLEKRRAPSEWEVAVERRGEVHRAPQSRFAANSSYAFDVAVTPRDGELLGKIFAAEHLTLRDHADWALGIVTGDNSGSLLDFSAGDAEPVLRGRDIFKFAFRAPRCYIRFQPAAFQQVAPERYYRAPEKLVYRFVSSQLVFAYDNRRLLTLNSANILIPRLPHMSILVALAFLNSRVFQYIFAKRFRTRKVLRGDLEALPFPVLPAAALRQLEEQVGRCMTGDYQPADELDRMIFRAFGLGDAEIGQIDESLAAEEGNILP